MILKRHICGLLQTNTYLLGCEKTKKAVIIDPGLKSSSWALNEAKKHSLEIEKILLTHHHFDHVIDVSPLKKQCQALICIHRADVEELKNLNKNPFKLHLEIFQPEVLLEDGQILAVGQLSLQVLHTPGHSYGSVCYYLKQENILFSGDTLFKGTIGRINVSEEELMWNSLKKLSLLPKETKVFPGHGEETTIGAESYLDNAKDFFS